MKFLLFLVSLFSTPAYATVEEAIFHKVNDYRAANGLKPLVALPVIENVAQRYSTQMAEHTMPYGHVGLKQRVASIQSKLPLRTSAGENVNWIYNSTDIAESAFQSWILSSEHLANILGDYTYTGIGLAKSRSNEYYVTQIFWN